MVRTCGRNAQDVANKTAIAMRAGAPSYADVPGAASVPPRARSPFFTSTRRENQPWIEDDAGLPLDDHQQYQQHQQQYGRRSTGGMSSMVAAEIAALQLLAAEPSDGLGVAAAAPVLVAPQSPVRVSARSSPASPSSSSSSPAAATAHTASPYGELHLAPHADPLSPGAYLHRALGGDWVHGRSTADIVALLTGTQQQPEQQLQGAVTSSGAAAAYLSQPLHDAISSSISSISIGGSGGGGVSSNYSGSSYGGTSYGSGRRSLTPPRPMLPHR